MDKATKLVRIKSIRAAALRVVEEIGSWHQVRMGSRDRAFMGAEIGDVAISYRTPFQLPPKVTYCVVPGSSIFSGGPVVVS